MAGSGVVNVAAALLAVAALAGCGPDVVMDEEVFKKANAHTVAILPFVLGKVGEPSELAQIEKPEERKEVLDRLETIRRIFYGNFRTGPYLCQRLEDTRRSLRRLGIQSGEDLKTGFGPDLAKKLCAGLAVDACILVEIVDLYNFKAGLIFRQEIEGRNHLHSKEGVELLSLEHTQSKTGGLLIQSDATIDAIQDSLENRTDLGFVRLAEEFALAVFYAFPPPPGPSPRESLLAAMEIKDVRLKPSRAGTLTVRDRLDIEVDATPGLMGIATVGPIVPLVEDPGKPGLYRGSHFVLPGEWRAGPVRVDLWSEHGLAKTRQFEDKLVEIDGRLPGPPQDLAIVVAAGGGAGRRLRWYTSPDLVARGYRVYRLGKDGTPTLLAEVAGTEHAVPAGAEKETYAVAGVNAFGHVGRLAVLKPPVGEGK